MNAGFWVSVVCAALGVALGVGCGVYSACARLSDDKQAGAVAALSFFFFFEIISVIAAAIGLLWKALS